MYNLMNNNDWVKILLQSIEKYIFDMEYISIIYLGKEYVFILDSNTYSYAVLKRRQQNRTMQNKLCRCIEM